MRMRCPKCGWVLSVPDDTTAKQGKCYHCGAVVDLTKAPRLKLKPGDLLGGCRVDELIGRGGMAAVYRATQLSLGRAVALKVLAPHLARQQQFVERFKREAAALAQLSHPNVVSILDEGVDGETYFFVMEFIDGESLRARLQRGGRMAFAEAYSLFDQIAAGLEYAHARGILHRDIKPENILMTSKGEPKITDFGIARLVSGEGAGAPRLTMAMTRMGTAHYMSPEQMRDVASVDHRSDIYSLGVVFYEMLTGELPVGQFKPPSELGDGVPPAVDDVVNRALAPEPDERFKSVGELRAALRNAVIHGVRPARRRTAVWDAGAWRRYALPGAAALTAIALIVIALLVAPWRSRETPRAQAPPPPPPPVENRDQRAAELFAQASLRAAKDQWGPAKDLLDKLDKEFRDTKLYADHRSDIADLRSQVEAMVRQKAPASKTEQPPKAKAEPEPKTRPKLEPPPDPKALVHWPKRWPPEKTPRPEPPPAVPRGPSKAEELLLKLKPLWAKRAYAPAAAIAQTALEEARTADARRELQPIARAAELLGRFGKAVADGAAALKGKPFRIPGKDMTALIAGVRGDSLQLALGGGETALKLAALDPADLLMLARAGLDPKAGDTHLMLALFAAFDSTPDIALARKELAAAKAAGAESADTLAVIELAALPSFEKLLSVAREKFEAGDYKAVRQAFEAARALRPDDPAARHHLDRALRVLLGQAVAACRAADFARGAELLASAQTLDPAHADVARLAAWLKVAGKPLFADAFDGPKLERWEVGDGGWSVAAGRLVGQGRGPDPATIFIRGEFQDFILTVEMGSPTDVRTSRFGALFRERDDQFAYCYLSSFLSQLSVGGARARQRGPLGRLPAVRFRYTRTAPTYLGGQSFPVEPGKTYQMTVRCVADDFQCFINEQLVAEGVTGGTLPAGRIGLSVHGGAAHFDNVRVFPATPLPDLALLKEVPEAPEPPKE